MSADHNRLDALRRVAKDRAATPAEKATARRFAKALVPRSASDLVGAGAGALVRSVVPLSDQRNCNK
jgi:hypothetical protein